MLPGGDSGGEPSLALTNVKDTSEAGVASIRTISEDCSEFSSWHICVSVARVASCECTVCSQQECCPAPMSHLPAIFLQQAISGSVIWRKSAAQAMAGSSVHANRTVAASQRAEILVTQLGYTSPAASIKLVTFLI